MIDGVKCIWRSVWISALRAFGTERIQAGQINKLQGDGWTDGKGQANGICRQTREASQGKGKGRKQASGVWDM